MIQNAPRYTEELRESKHHKRRKAERIWRRNSLNIDHQLYSDQSRHAGKMLTVSMCGQKALFWITKNPMEHKEEIILPSYSSENDVANKFSDFFTKKTARIRDKIINNGSCMSDTIVTGADVKFEGQHLAHFKLDTQDEVRVVIMKSSSKSCAFDPLATNLLKKVLQCLLPFIT